MKIAFGPFAALAAVTILVAAGITRPAAQGAVADAPANGGSGPGDDAVWLGHGFMVSPAAVATVPDVAEQLRSFRIRTLFVNVGQVESDGTLINPAHHAREDAAFLNTLGQWEETNNYTFRVLAMVNANLSPEKPHRLNLDDPEALSNLVSECGKFLFPAVPGSHVAGAKRPFDGIQLDAEPSEDPTTFAELLDVMDRIKALAPDKVTSFTAEKYGDRPWWWTGQDFYDMARHCDLLAIMTYDSDSVTGDGYRTWISNQTVSVLRAVAGEEWNNDANHPAPAHAEVYMGLPAFPANPHHVTAAETIQFAAPGVKAGLEKLRGQNDLAAKYFSGAAVFLYTDGSGTDGYSDLATDWGWYQNFWLGQ